LAPWKDGAIYLLSAEKIISMFDSVLEKEEERESAHSRWMELETSNGGECAFDPRRSRRVSQVTSGQVADLAARARPFDLAARFRLSFDSRHLHAARLDARLITRRGAREAAVEISAWWGLRRRLAVFSVSRFFD